MRSKKTVTILLIVMALVIVSVPTLVMADVVDGKITIASNTPPVINSFTVTNTDDSAIGTSLSPTTTYKVHLEVTDNDGLANLQEVMVMFWHSTTAGDPTALKVINEGDNDSSLEHWIRVEDTDGIFTHDNTLTSWLTSAPTVGTVSNTRTTDFTVTVGKEAVEAPIGDDLDKWIIAVYVQDEGGNEVFQVFEPGVDRGMTWYGEMVIDAGAGPEWSYGVAGMAFADDPQQMFTDSYRLKVVSNGTYDLSTYIATTWTDSGSAQTITYDAAATAADQFAIAVDTNPTYNVGTAQTFTSAGATTDTITIPRSVWGSATGQAGVYVNNIYMFLQTNATMTDSIGAYTGEVTINIANGT